MGRESVWQRVKNRFFSPGNPPEEGGCFWQTDLHSHLLPGVDDGVKTLDQTLVCLRQLAEWGIRRVITTPHVSRDWYPNRAAELQAGLTSLRDLIQTHDLPLTIDIAAEYMLDDFFPDLLASGEVLSFGTERYLLVETGWASAPMGLDNLLFRVQTQGYIPLLAHPERYSYYHDDEAGLARLREAGCLFQVNWPSLTGRYGRRVRKQANLLLKNKWVDFIGSDLHRPTDLENLGELFGTDEYRLLKQQPLRNAELVG